MPPQFAGERRKTRFCKAEDVKGRVTRSALRSVHTFTGEPGGLDAKWRA
jgi:hypothetical protein